MASMSTDGAMDMEGDDACFDAKIVNGQLYLRRERQDGGNGRVYRVSFTAISRDGGTAEGTVLVIVPGKAGVARAVNDGQIYNSREGCPGDGHMDMAMKDPRSTGIAFTTSLALPHIEGGRATVEYTLSQPGEVNLAIFDVAGRRVASLADGVQGGRSAQRLPEAPACRSRHLLRTDARGGEDLHPPNADSDDGQLDGITRISMPVAVMNVVDVRMAMRHRFVTMPVGMGRLLQLPGRVLVLVVLVVVMLVGVLQSLVLMVMFMTVRGEEEGARGHGNEREQSPNGKGFAQEDQGEDRGETGREREEHSCLNHPQVSEPPHEEHDRKAEGNPTHSQRGQKNRCVPVPEASKRGGEQETRDSAGQPLDGDDLPGIAQAHALRQVVVQTPQSARAYHKGNPRPASRNRRRFSMGKREHNSAPKDGESAQPSAASQILAG
jgi:hypothetical protein